MIQINIPMPENCYDCPFSDDSGDYPYCWVLHQNRGYTFDRRKRKFPNCPLQVVKQEEKKDDYKDICRVLFNRCRAVGSCNGQLCIFCGLKAKCEEMKTSEGVTHDNV